MINVSLSECSAEQTARGNFSWLLPILDLGVGSGALLCALLIEFADARGVGVDISGGAADIARANLDACGLTERADIRVGDWTYGLEGPFDLIVSNPPYIASAEIAALAPEVRDYDPRAALDGGADGLDYYRTIAAAVPALLKPAGVVVVELGAGQAEAVAALFAAELRTWPPRADFAGVPRALVASKPTTAPR